MTAGLILGIIWSARHIPVVLSDPTLRVPLPFFSAVLSLSILSTWLFLRTGGSVLIAVLFHAWYDLLLAFFGQKVARDEYALLWWLLFVVQTLVAIAIAYVLRGEVTGTSAPEK